MDIEFLYFCQNPNSAHISIQQSLRLDYILTGIHPTHPPGTLHVVVVNWTACTQASTNNWIHLSNNWRRQATIGATKQKLDEDVWPMRMYTKNKLPMLSGSVLFLFDGIPFFFFFYGTQIYVIFLLQTSFNWVKIRLYTENQNPYFFISKRFFSQYNVCLAISKT